MPASYNTNIDDDRYIKGATDDTLTGNVGDRLKVTGTLNPTPAVNVVYKEVLLQSGGSAQMSVNGSSSSVNFDFTPGAGEIWYWEGISLLISDTGVVPQDEFGSLNSVLTNGLKLSVRTGGTEYEVVNLTDNTNLSLFFSESSYTPAGSAGWLDDDDLFMGNKKWSTPITLSGDSGDFIRFQVRDNLNGLSNLQSMVKLWRTI